MQAHSYKQDDQYYQLTDSMCLHHSHPCDKFLFCHLILNDDTIAIIKSLSECNIDNIRIAEYIEKVKGIYMTTSQIRYILNQMKQKEVVSETDDLDKKMKEEQGLSIIKPPDEICGRFFRRAIATFTKDELMNLQNFGDLVGIDPTFYCLKSNWSIIPLTVIGNDRQILSGGCIFSSNVTNDIFCWILKLLAYDLPCSPIIKTICSDDDLALESAFLKVENDPSISCLKRIICIWHKMQKFKEIVNRLQLTAEEKNDIILKFKLMINTRNEEKCIFLKESLVSIKEIKEFFDTTMKNRISTSTKAYAKDVWSLGYLTSSISEINNSNIKQLMGNRALTLCEMRDVLTHADKSRTHNRMFIKKRKQRKAYGSDVLKFMKNCNVDKRIAEALNGSYQKSIKVKVLSINDFWQVTEESGDSFYVQNAQKWTCSCGKLSSSGFVLLIKTVNNILKIEKIEH